MIEENPDWNRCIDDNSIKLGRCVNACNENQECEDDCLSSFKTRQLNCPCEVSELWYSMIISVKLRRIALLVVLAAILNVLQQQQHLKWQQLPYPILRHRQIQKQYLSWVLTNPVISQSLSISMVSFKNSIYNNFMLVIQLIWRKRISNNFVFNLFFRQCKWRLWFRVRYWHTSSSRMWRDFSKWILVFWW